jgi:hypothetical protein
MGAAQNTALIQVEEELQALIDVIHTHDCRVTRGTYGAFSLLDQKASLVASVAWIGDSACCGNTLLRSFQQQTSPRPASLKKAQAAFWKLLPYCGGQFGVQRHMVGTLAHKSQKHIIAMLEEGGIKVYNTFIGHYGDEVSIVGCVSKIWVALDAAKRQSLGYQSPCFEKDKTGQYAWASRPSTTQKQAA